MQISPELVGHTARVGNDGKGTYNSYN